MPVAVDMSVDSEEDAQMSPKEVAAVQQFEAHQFRVAWAKAGLSVHRFANPK